MIELETITKLSESLRKLPGVGIKTTISGKEYYAGTMIYIKKYGDITMYNLVTGEQQEINRQ